MAQHDYNLANQSGLAFRSDLNDLAAAIVSQNSGATAPATTFAFMWWADTSTGKLKIRNAANSAWIDVGTLASANLGLAIAGAITASGLTQSTAKLLGRTTAGTGSPEEISVGAGLSLAAGVLSASGGVQIQPISASVGSNALTISASALSLDFRSTTLGSGAVTTVSGTPSSLVISSGSTLGTVNAVQSRIAVLALNNAGTIELAAVNVSGGNDLSETGLISTTAEGGAGAADSASVIYSTTARTNVAYRVIGYVESTQATAGTWATAPSTIQGAGGSAMAGLMTMGHGQTWQDVTGSRSIGTTYYNTTGKPIMVAITIINSSAYAPSFSVGGVTIGTLNMTNMTRTSYTFAVPPGMSYSMTTSSGSGTISTWAELR